MGNIESANKLRKKLDNSSQDKQNAGASKMEADTAKKSKNKK